MFQVLGRDLLQYARNLRKEMTPHERKLWYLFLRTYPIKFYKQKIIGNSILDFYCPSVKLAIEIDGTQHFYDNERVRDASRSAVLQLQDITVIRFTNKEIDDDFSAVCERIHYLVEKLSNL